MAFDVVSLPHLFTARHYQKPGLKAFFKERFKKLFLLWHRRAGKDLTCINMLIPAAFERVGTYLFLLPQQNQARRVIWTGMDGQGIPFLDRIPKQLVAKKNNQDMSIDLINGSRICIGGSNNYNAWVGSNPVGIINSEYPLHTPMARQYFAPILAENGGWEICEGTPRGKNHAYHVWQQAVASKDEWFTQKLTVDDTFRENGKHVITPEDVARERRGGMSDEMVRQEFYCDWNVGLMGAYYTREMQDAEDEGRVGYIDVSMTHPVYTFWDIGVHDATSIWWMQPKNGNLDLIYYYEATDQGIEHFIDKIWQVQAMFKFKYHTHYGPHDMANREWGSNARSRMNLAIQHGLTFNIVQATKIEDGIQAVKSIFPRCRFHVEHTRHGIECLKEYRRKYDEVNQVFMTAPLHNWASNGSDAFRYFAVKWSDLFTHPHQAAIKYENGF